MGPRRLASTGLQSSLCFSTPARQARLVSPFHVGRPAMRVRPGPAWPAVQLRWTPFYSGPRRHTFQRLPTTAGHPTPKDVAPLRFMPAGGSTPFHTNPCGQASPLRQCQLGRESWSRQASTRCSTPVHAGRPVHDHKRLPTPADRYTPFHAGPQRQTSYRHSTPADRSPPIHTVLRLSTPAVQ